MKGKIKKQHVAQFNPTFQTVINGKPTKVTLKQAEENAEIYALTPIGVLYENSEKLIEDVKKRQKKVEVEKLDMNKVRRGTAFDPNAANTKKSAIEAFKEKQELNLMKMAKRKGKPMQEAVVVKEVSEDEKEVAKAKKAKEIKEKEAAKTE